MKSKSKLRKTKKCDAWNKKNMLRKTKTSRGKQKLVTGNNNELPWNTQTPRVYWNGGVCDTPSSRLPYNNDVIRWKHYQHYWPFVRGIHWSPVDSPHKGQWRGALMFSLICARADNYWSKQSRRRWFETPMRPICRYCNATASVIRS